MNHVLTTVRRSAYGHENDRKRDPEMLSGLTSGPADELLRIASVKLAARGDEDAFDAQYTAERVEVSVVVQHCAAAL